MGNNFGQQRCYVTCPLILCVFVVYNNYATFEVRYIFLGGGLKKQFQEFAFLYFGLIINTAPSLPSPFPSDSVCEMGAFFCWDPRLGCQDWPAMGAAFISELAVSSGSTLTSLDTQPPHCN